MPAGRPKKGNRDYYVPKRNVFIIEPWMVEEMYAMNEMHKALDLYPDHMKDEIVYEKYHKAAKSLLLEGEEYVLLEGKAFDYAFTSYGRSLNLRKKSSPSLSIYPESERIATMMRDRMINLKEEMPIHGWEYDYYGLLDIYKKYNVKTTFYANTGDIYLKVK